MCSITSSIAATHSDVIRSSGPEPGRLPEVPFELLVECGGELVEAVVEVRVSRPEVVAEHSRAGADVHDRRCAAFAGSGHDHVEADPVPEGVSGRIEEFELLVFERRHRRACHVVEVFGRHGTSVSGRHDEYG